MEGTPTQCKMSWGKAAQLASTKASTDSGVTLWRSRFITTPTGHAKFKNCRKCADYSEAKENLSDSRLPDPVSVGCGRMRKPPLQKASEAKLRVMHKTLFYVPFSGG